MKKFFLLLALATFLVANNLVAQPDKGMPEWPIRSQSYNNSSSSVDRLNAETVLMEDSQSPHNFQNIPGTLANTAGSSQAGFDCCGHMVYFVLHDGSTADNHLQVYLHDGTLLTTTTAGGGMNGYKVDNEIQCVPVPNTCDEWYIIYNKNGTQSYNSSKVLYSRIKIVNNILTYVEKDITLEVLSTAHTYSYGKAVSILMNPGSKSEHFNLYLYRRSEDPLVQYHDSIIIDRFSITSWNGIKFKDRSNSIYDIYWGNGTTVGTVQGSPLELSNDGKILAANVRKQDNISVNDESRILLFNTTSFAWTNPKVIRLNQQDRIYTTGNEQYLNNWSRKIHGMELSPNATKIWISGGGYVNGGQSNLTYIGTIDISNFLNDGSVSNRVYLQCQVTPGWSSSSGVGQSWGSIQDQNYINSHMIGALEKSYDGNMYFNKTNVDTLFVIPNTMLENNCPVDVTPHDINFATLSDKNIPVSGYPVFLPDQIDGYDYSYGTPVVTISGAPLTSIPAGTTVTLYSTPSTGIWSIDPSIPLFPTADASACNITFTTIGTYTVYYEYKNGCIDSVKITVIKNGGNDTICGTKIWDLNCNGKPDSDEPGLAGWTFQLIQGNVIATTTTDANGEFCFEGLDEGTYIIQEVVQNGSYPSHPENGYYTVVIDSNYNGTQHLWFLNCILKDSLCGKKILDVNCNGRIDPEDTGIANWPINLWKDGVPFLETVTGPNGNYCFTNLSYGNYIVQEGEMSGYTPKNPESGQYNVILDATHHSQFNLNFLNCKDSTSGDNDCCDSVTFEPYVHPDETRSARSVIIFNTKIPTSPISYVEIKYFDCANNTQITDNGTLNQLSGGQPRMYRYPSEFYNLYSTGNPNQWFSATDHFQRLPRTDLSTNLPAFGSPASTYQNKITFNLSLPNEAIPTGWCIKLVIHHEDGSICEEELPQWIPSSDEYGNGNKIVTVVEPTQKKYYYVASLNVDLKQTKGMQPSLVVLTGGEIVYKIAGGTGGLWEAYGLKDSNMRKTINKFVQTDNSAMFTFNETCDGVDNDCDGRVDLFLESDKQDLKPNLKWYLFDNKCNVMASDTFSTVYGITDIRDDQAEMIYKSGMSINSVIPNPTTGLMNIEFFLMIDDFIKVELINDIGQPVAQVFDGYRLSGINKIQFDGGMLYSGSYLLKITSSTGVVTSKVSIIK